MNFVALVNGIELAFSKDWFITKADNFSYNKTLSIIHKYIDGINAYVSFPHHGNSWKSMKYAVTVTYSGWQGFRDNDRRVIAPNVYRKIVDLNLTKSWKSFDFNVFASEATTKMIDVHNINNKIVSEKTKLFNDTTSWNESTINYINNLTDGAYTKNYSNYRYGNNLPIGYIADIRLHYSDNKVTGYIITSFDKSHEIMNLIADDVPYTKNQYVTSYSTADVRYNFKEKKAEISFSCSKELAVRIFNLVKAVEEKKEITYSLVCA